MAFAPSVRLCVAQKRLSRRLLNGAVRNLSVHGSLRLRWINRCAFDHSPALVIVAIHKIRGLTHHRDGLLALIRRHDWTEMNCAAILKTLTR
jgi:hypothetical protein